MVTTATKGWVGGLAGVLAAGVWAAVRAPIAESSAVSDLLVVIGQWPKRTGTWQIDHFADAPLGVLAAQGLGVDTAFGLYRLGAVAALVAMAGMATWSWVAASGHRWRAARLALLGPAVAVMLFWLGFYDPFTILAWCLVLFAWLAGRPWALALAAVPLGFQHFEQGAVGVVVLWLTWLALGERVPGRLAGNPLWGLAGVAVGKASLIVVMALHGQSLDSRGQWLELFLGQWTKAAIVTAPILLWSLFAGLWPVVGAMWQRLDSRRPRMLLAGAMAVGLGAMLLSGDRPRVFVIVTLPAVLLVIVALASATELSAREWNLIEAVAWVAPPILLVGTEVANANIVDTTVPALLHLTGLG